MVAKAARIKAWAPEKLICLRLGSGITVLYSLTLYLGIKSPCGVHTPVQATVWQMAKNCLALRSNVEVQVTLSTAFANTRWPQNGQWRMAALKQLQDSRRCWETLKKAWDIFYCSTPQALSSQSRTRTKARKQHIGLGRCCNGRQEATTASAGQQT